MQPVSKKELPEYMRKAFARPTVSEGGFAKIPFETALRAAWRDLAEAQTRRRPHGHFGIVSILDDAVVKGPLQRMDTPDFLREEMIMQEMAGAVFPAPVYHSSNPDFLQFRMNVVAGEKLGNAALKSLSPDKKHRVVGDIAASMAGLAAHFENRDISHIPAARKEMAEVSPEKLAYVLEEGCVAQSVGQRALAQHTRLFMPYFERLGAQEPVMIHGDAADYNVLVTEDGAATLIDYAFARKHYPQRDILGFKPLGRDFCTSLVHAFNERAGTGLLYADVVAFDAARNLMTAEMELGDFYTPEEVAICPVLDNLAKDLPPPVPRVTVPVNFLALPSPQG